MILFLSMSAVHEKVLFPAEKNDIFNKEGKGGSG